MIERGNTPNIFFRNKKLKEQTPNPNSTVVIIKIKKKKKDMIGFEGYTHDGWLW